MINLKKNIKFLITLFILLGLSFYSNFVYAASGSGDDATDKTSLYKSGKKLVLRAKKLEKKDKIEKAKKILNEKIDDLHKLSKALLTYETLTGEEIKDLIYKSIQPKLSTKDDDKVEEASSALGSLGLKPKPAH